MKNFHFLVRIRNAYQTDEISSSKFNKINNIKQSKILMRSSSPTLKKLILKERIEKYKGNSNESNIIANHYQDDLNYTIFSSVQISNLILFSPKPISGKQIKNNFFSKKDILKYSSTIIDKSNILEFDGVYTGEISIEQIYLNKIQSQIQSLFEGINASIFLVGPSDSGKSYTFRGDGEETGLIEYSIDEIFNYIEKCDNAMNSLKLYLSIYHIINDEVVDLLSLSLSNNQQSNNNHENLREQHLINKTEFFCLLNEVMKTRKNLALANSQIFNYLKKTHFITRFKLISNGKTFSQADFIELSSSQFGLNLNQNDRTNESIWNDYKSISDSISCFAEGKQRVINTSLLSSLSESFDSLSNVVFIGCLKANEYPLTDSLSALKYCEFLRSQFDGGINNLNKSVSTQSKHNDSFNNQYARGGFNKENIRNNSNYDLEDEYVKEQKFNKNNFRNKDLSQSVHSSKNEFRSNHNEKFNQSITRENVSEKILNELNQTKADNVIFREEINRLFNLNTHIESELQKQRNKYIEIVSENERLLQENLMKNSEIEKMTIELAKFQSKEKDSKDIFSLKIQFETRINELEKENKRLESEKSKYEIDFKVLQERHLEMKTKYEKNEFELNYLRISQNEEMKSIEVAIDKMTKDLENYQRENNTLRSNEEKLRAEITNLEKQTTNYKEKYQESKMKNNLMNTKILEIESEMKILVNEKEREYEALFKKNEENNRKNKFENNKKLFEEMQSKLSTLKNNLRIKRLKQNE